MSRNNNNGIKRGSYVCLKGEGTNFFEKHVTIDYKSGIQLKRVRFMEQLPESNDLFYKYTNLPRKRM